MANNFELKLCGGTFLVLMLEAKGQRRVARVRVGRSSDNKSNPEIFGILVKLTNPHFILPEGRSFGTFTSDYKLCRKSDSPSALLTDDVIIHEFDKKIKTQYYEYLGLFYGMLERVLDWGTKDHWLVAALIDLIESDATIPDNAQFYVRPYGHSVAKSDLRKIECICIPSFVLGVWHYIVTNIKNNEAGIKTINVFLDNNVEKRAERKFISDIGQKTALSIKTSINVPEIEYPNYSHPKELQEIIQQAQFTQIMPGVMAGTTNIKEGQIYVNGQQVVALEDLQKVEAGYHTPFSSYIKKSAKYHSHIKTLLYSESPHLFKDLVLVRKCVGDPY